MDNEWAIKQLDDFDALVRLGRPGFTKFQTLGTLPEILASAQVVEQILDRVVPGWRTPDLHSALGAIDRWSHHREASARAHAALVRLEELAEKLGDGAPQLSAATFHAWAWEGARSLWASRHFREAVGGAAVKVNAETQNKLLRFDVAETALFREAFSSDPPKAGAPRLRLMTDDGSATFKSLQRGAMAFAEGCYGAIRNPIAHRTGDITEPVALEQLAAFSVLARWVDDAVLQTV